MNGTSTSTALQTGSKMIDDFLRRELRVGDPRNPTEIVTALRRRYASEAARIDQESSGVPVRFAADALIPELLASSGPSETPGSREERRVQANLEADLTALIDAAANREWRPELLGWRALLPRELSDGAAAARWAQDPAQRERAFLAVRRMGEFARVARLVGVMNLSVNCEYRRLATTLDEAASVIRILAGEALYNAGLADGGMMVQVPVVDIRQRRDALVVALRRLSGVIEIGEDWGDDAAAYGWLVATLEQRSATELRVYLREETLTIIVDSMVSAVSRQDPESLRQVASTLPVEVTRLTRLLHIADGQDIGPPGSDPRPASAPLEHYVHTLQLFVDAFAAPRSGARLIDLALPLSMAAQQVDEADAEGRRILRDLVGQRGEYAREVECFLQCCGCEIDKLECQVKLDKVLYDLDRAIDLYALGAGHSPDWNDEERRAAVYGHIAGNLALEPCINIPAMAPVHDLLTHLRDLLIVALPGDPIVANALKDSVFQEQLRAEIEWKKLVEAMASRCLNPIFANLILAGRQLLHGSPDYRNVDPEKYGRPALLTAERVTSAQIVKGIDIIADRLQPPGAPAPQPTPAPAPDRWRPELCAALRDLLESADAMLSEGFPNVWNDWLSSGHDSSFTWPRLKHDLGASDARELFEQLFLTVKRGTKAADELREVKRSLLTACQDVVARHCPNNERGRS